MKRIIKLDSIDKVKEFVNIAGRYAGNVRLSSGESTANGKSIMDILSLDLQHELVLNIKAGKNSPAFIQELEPYMLH